MKNLALMVIVGLALQGCVTVTTPMVSSMNFSPESMEIVGRAKGEVTIFRFLGLPFSTGGAGTFCTDTAIYHALATSGGDALINSSVDDDKSTLLGFLAGWETIRVSGTAIRFRKNIPPPVLNPSTSRK